MKRIITSIILFLLNSDVYADCRNLYRDPETSNEIATTLDTNLIVAQIVNYLTLVKDKKRIPRKYSSNLLKRIKQEIRDGLWATNIKNMSSVEILHYYIISLLKFFAGPMSIGPAYLEDSELTFKEIISNQYVRIELSDPEDRIDHVPAMKAVVDLIQKESASFRTLDLFRGRIKITGNIMTFRMDPGSHKEALHVIISEDPAIPHVLYYEHTPSEFERNSPYHGRFRYIKAVTQWIREESKNPLITMKEDTYAHRYSELVFINSIEEIKPYLRLCQSVKNLDIVLSTNRDDQIDLAVDLFRQGVVNMHIALAVVKRKLEVPDEEHTKTSITGRITSAEEAIIDRYVADVISRQEYNQTKESIRKLVNDLREVKDLNYTVLSMLRTLDDQARELLTYEVPTQKGADAFIDIYFKLMEQFEMMKEKFFRLYFLGDPSQAVSIIKQFQELRSKLDRAVDHLAMVGRFGYGEPEVKERLKVTGDLSSIEYLSDSAKRAYAEFSGLLLSDRGSDVQHLQEVNSLEEAIRLIHKSAVELPAFYYFFKNTLSFTPEEVKEYYRGNILIIDVTTKGYINTPFHRVLFKRGLDNIEVEQSQVYPNNSIIIVGDNYAEISVGLENKHKLELILNYDGRISDFVVSFRYIESGYPQAENRQDLVNRILSDEGFSITRERQKYGLLVAQLRTARKDTWEKGCITIIRLIEATKDFDLGFAFDKAYKNFKQGLTRNYVVRFADFEDLISSLESHTISKKAKDAVRSIMSIGSVFDKEVLIQTFVDYYTDFASIILYIKSLKKEHLKEMDRYIVKMLGDTPPPERSKRLAGFHNGVLLLLGR